MATPSLKIAGISLSIISWLDFDQSIEPIGGSSFRRLAGGSGFKMTHWQRHLITLSAAGWVPAAINAIDYSAPFEIELPWPETFNGGEALPAGWSQRAAPWDERTVTDQAGNPVRLVWPRMTVFSDGPRKTNSGANPSWELVCEVV